MADTTALTRRIDLRLEAVARRLHALPTYAEQPGFDLDALEAEWRDTLDRLARLHQLAMQGDPTADQFVQHSRLLRLLARYTYTPMLERLGLQPPGGELAAWLAQHPEAATLADPA